MSEVILLIEEAPEGGYAARALGYSIYTEADSWADLKTVIQDAIACHFEHPERPAMVRMHHVCDDVFEV